MIVKAQEAKRTTFAMGTIAHLRAYGNNAEEAINHAVERLNEIDDKFSVFKPESDISGINAEAGNDAIKISNDTLFLLKRAKEYSNKDFHNDKGRPDIRHEHHIIPGYAGFLSESGKCDHR